MNRVHELIGTEWARKQNLTGKGVGVAVLDTGVYPHPDFGRRLLAFKDMLSGKRTPYDDNSHGTHVSGIIGGDGSASGGRIRGIAPECNLVALKILDRYGNGKKRDPLCISECKIP